MILGLGLDVVEISRIKQTWERFGDRFAQRILHADELSRFTHLNSTIVQFLASRFAAKEAAVKALGTGFSNGIAPSDIAVITLPGGKPELQLHNQAQRQYNDMKANRVHLSLTHGKETVAAVVILECIPTRFQ